MLTATTKFKDHLRASHSRRTRAGLYIPSGSSYDFVGYLGIVDGSLSLDYSRNMRRQSQGLRVAPLDSTLDYSFASIAARDYLEALTAGSAEIDIEWGMVYPDRTTEWVSIARLRVEESTLDSNAASVTINAAYDAGTRVNDFGLILPYAPYDTFSVKMTCLAAIQDLVNASYPSAAPPTWDIAPGVDLVTAPPDGTVFTGSRWDAVLSLAAAINVSVGPDAAGVWVVKPVTVDTVVVWTVDSGATGVLVGESTQFSRREQYNAVGVRWEMPTGTGGGLVYIVDSDPDSPTFYDGPFGRKPRPEENIDTITTEEQAIAAGYSLLEKYRGKTRGISLEAVHNPLLEPGDPIAVFLPDGSAERHVIDTISLPLAAGKMSMETRVLRTGSIMYNESGVDYEDSRYTYAGQGV